MILLLLTDIVWSISAIFYDAPQLLAQPLYLWPFLIVCPLYPLLLAYIWWQIEHEKKTNNYIFALGTIGSVYFCLSAILFYPIDMFQLRFTWWSVGAIFWVLFYGLQGFYLIKRYSAKLHTLPTLMVALYLSIKLYLDWRYKTFGYFIDLSWSNNFLNIIAVFQLVLIFIFATVPLWHRNRSSKGEV